MHKELQKFKDKALGEIRQSQALELLEEIWRKYLGRKGELREFIDKLKNLAKEEKVKAGQLINEIKKELEAEISSRKNQLANLQTDKFETIDVTLPGKKPEYGHLHPHTQMKYRVAEIFHSMGFEVLDGPEMETDYYNFESLNIPKDHPARDVQDTFFIKDRPDLVMRTQTSAMQVRVMEKRKPPLRVIVPGRCFRHEATDASHEHTFYQVEGFVVDKEISVANLIYTLKSFLSALFKKEIEVRLRPGYFPFVEPGFELDFRCIFCQGKGCSVCQQSGWIELIPCGMIHPKVFEYAGYPKGKYTGFAFGAGLDRIVMLYHKINDIRLFHSGDLRFIKQF